MLVVISLGEVAKARIVVKETIEKRSRGRFWER